VISGTALDIDAEVSSGELRLVTRPGIVVDADDAAIRSGEVKVRAPWDQAATPVLPRVTVAGKAGSGRIKAGPPRRSFWQWLTRRPRPYAITAG
jgi:hypothetical protein